MLQHKSQIRSIATPQGYLTPPDIYQARDKKQQIFQGPYTSRTTVNTAKTPQRKGKENYQHTPAV